MYLHYLAGETRLGATLGVGLTNPKAERVGWTWPPTRRVERDASEGERPLRGLQLTFDVCCAAALAGYLASWGGLSPRMSC